MVWDVAKDGLFDKPKYAIIVSILLEFRVCGWVLNCVGLPTPLQTLQFNANVFLMKLLFFFCFVFP